MTAIQKIACIVFLISLISSCASTPPPASSGSKDTELKKEFLNEFARAKLKKNGPSLLCDQQGYLRCYEISHQQCIAELSSAKEACFQRAEKKFPNDLSNASDIDAFSKYYVTCLSFHHVVRHSSKDTKALGACLKNVKWDKAQRDRSLLK